MPWQVLVHGRREEDRLLDLLKLPGSRGLRLCEKSTLGITVVLYLRFSTIGDVQDALRWYGVSALPS